VKYQHPARSSILTAALVLGSTLGLAAPPAAADDEGEERIRVSTELVMLIDVSGSVDDHEFFLQRKGYIDAFRNEDVQKMITLQDGVAVRFVQWSSTNRRYAQQWHILRTASDCNQYADAIARETRRFRGGTYMAPAIDWAVTDITTNTIDSSRGVIDISGDGVCANYRATARGYYRSGARYGSRNWDEVMERLEEHNIAINAISIGNTRGLAQWYADNVPRGEGSFAMHAEDFSAFGEGIKQKLIKELDPTYLDALYD